MAEVKSWINEPKNFGFRDELVDAHTKVDTPTGLKTKLQPHQQTAVRAMRDLEQRRVLEIAEESWIEHTQDNYIETHLGVLSDKFGSGKTIDILALVMGPDPLEVAEILQYPATNDLPPVAKRRQTSDYYGFVHEVRRVYAKRIDPTLILVGRSVIFQWVQAIERFTDLKVLVINSFKHFLAFYKMFTTDISELNQYDIVLVKNASMSSKTFLKTMPIFKDTAVGATNQKPIINVLYQLTMHFNYKWRRVVLDDFDTIKINMNARVIPADFTWLISATRKRTARTTYISAYEFGDTIEERLRWFRPTYNSLFYKNELFTVCNIRNESDFIDECVNITMPKFYVYSVFNPNNKYMELLDAMGADDARTVMEMLNGGAMKTACEYLGTKANSEAEIFQLILGKKYKSYKNAVMHFKHARAVKGFIEPMPVSKFDIGEEPIKVLRTNLKEMGPVEELVFIDQQFADVRATVQEANYRYAEQKDNHGKAINRVIDNIKEGFCPVCASPISAKEEGEDSDDDFDLAEFGLDDDFKEEKLDAMIMKCCGVIICSNCVSGSTHLHRAGTNVVGSCPNCKRSISYKSMIFLDRGLDTNAIINEEFEEPPVEEEAPADAAADEPKEPTKLDVIVNIIKGTPPKDRKEVKMDIPSLLGGHGTLPDAPDPTKTKSVVFANFEETLSDIKQRLDKEKISYLQVNGTPKQIAEKVESFRKDVQVMLVNGSQYCAGLNLQFADNIIFAHKIIDSAVEGQLAGRLQRLGRKTCLQIHYVVYDNEKNFLNRFD